MQTRIPVSAEANQHQSHSAQQPAQLLSEQQSSFEDHSPRAAQLTSLQAMISDSLPQLRTQTRQAKMDGSAQAQQLRTLQTQIADDDVAQRVSLEEPLQAQVDGSAVQREEVATAAQASKPNNTGLPDNLKSGIESLSGMSMDHVKVHYNSSQPAQLNAHAYAQGSEIHVAPGQEQHVPHEAWHVVQQAQGRVRPTMQMKMGVPVNDDVGLETEADVMGARALGLRAMQMRTEKNVGKPVLTPSSARPTTIAQRQIREMANRSPQTVQQRAIQRMRQGQVVQLGQGQSSEKKEETISKLESYLKSSGIDHGGEKDATATRTAKIMDGWRKEKKIVQFWLTNQSNIIEFQKSKYKAMGGACYVIMQSFLRHALTDGSQTDVLDQFNVGDLSESLEMEVLLTERLSRCQEIRMELDANGLVIDAELEKEKEAQNIELITEKLQENGRLLDRRREIMNEIQSKLIQESGEKDMKGFDASATIGEIKSLAEGAYEIRLLREDQTGHALGIVKSKDFEGNAWYDFMDPSSMSFSGRESSLEKVEKILSTFYATKYVNIKIIQYEKFA